MRLWLVAALGVALAGAIVWGALAVLDEGDAQADETKSWKWGPSVAAAVVAIDAKTGDYTAGLNAIPLGACLGVTFLPASLGADGCFNAQLSKADPNRYFPSLMLHWKDWVNAGAGILGQQKEDHSGLFWHVLILVGGRLGFAGG